MTIVSAYVLPHGALVLDPKDEESSRLSQAMKVVAREIRSLNPDYIFLSTPHGIANTHDFCLYQGNEAAGSAEWEDKYTDFRISLRLADDLTNDLIDSLSVNNSVSGILCFGGSSPFQLRWGEVIPLWFLYKEYNEKLPPTCILSQPSRRYTEAPQMVTELKRLGKNINRYFEKNEKRVVVIISGDLAHTHQETGPYGYSEDAEKFDASFSRWVEGESDAFFEMISLTNTALSCGFTGIMMLQGILEDKEVKERVLLENLHPTYYGMPVAKFLF